MKYLLLHGLMPGATVLRREDDQYHHPGPHGCSKAGVSSVITDAMHSPADEWVPAGVSDDGRDNPIGLQPTAGSDAGAEAMKCNVRSGVHLRGSGIVA